MIVINVETLLNSSEVHWVLYYLEIVWHTVFLRVYRLMEDP